jgi:hypothetical protein
MVIAKMDTLAMGQPDACGTIVLLEQQNYVTGKMMIVMDLLTRALEQLVLVVSILEQETLAIVTNFVSVGNVFPHHAILEKK